MHQCQHYELPSSKEDFFQPIGEELQFRIKYKHKQLLGGLGLPEPIAVVSKPWLDWATKQLRVKT